MTVEDWKLQPARDLGLSPGQRLRSLQRESGLLESFAHLGWWTLVHAYLSVAHRLKVHGRRHIPRKPPFILVANHSSHLDALVLAARLPWRIRDQIFPIAAGDVFFETPVVSLFAAGFLNALPMWRKKCGPHAMHELRQRLLEEPCAYVLFPEGTRSHNGQMSSFKPGLGMIVAETSVPVVPCYLAGTYQALPPDRRWPSFAAITVRMGAPLVFAETKNDRSGWKAIAEATEAAVRRLGGEGVTR